MSNVKISLIIPTYNRDNTLEKLLISLKQINILDRNDIEVIIIQNHPSVDCYSQTKKFENKYKVKCFHEKREGKAASLNLGINNASGKYIAFTDDDVEVKDYLWLDKLYNHFLQNTNLGYVSGKVTIDNNYANASSKLWESKGGLSKGSEQKYWSRNFLLSKKFSIFPWPLHKICAGANCMIPKEVLIKVGGYAEFLGIKKNVDGLTLEIGYKIAKNGFELLYEPSAEIFHKHPQTSNEVKKKLFYYGKQDTGCSMYIYLKHKDYRYLWWAIIGHFCYTCNKILRRIIGKYPLPINYIFYGLFGNIIGWMVCLKNFNTDGGVNIE